MLKDTNITIGNLIDSGLTNPIIYQRDVVITEVNDLDLFRHPCHLLGVSILVCLDGEMEGTIDLQPIHVGPNSVLLSLPENIIQITRVSNLRAYAIIISSDYLSDLALEIMSHTNFYMYEVKKSPVFTLPPSEVSRFTSYLTLFQEIVPSELSAGKSELVRHLTSTFVVDVMVLHHHYHTAEPTDSRTSRTGRMMLDRFIELLRLYHAQERELQFYADKMCITPKYLSGVVRKASGRRATEWISEYVVLEAKSLLRYSGKNIQQISTLLNFPSQSAFGKYFKAQTGLSPTEFMESHQMFEG